MRVFNPIITGSLTLSGSFLSDRTLGITVTNATSASYADSAPYSGITGKPTLVSGSTQITYSELSGIPANIVSSSAQINYSGSYETIVVTQASLAYFVDGVSKPKITLQKGHTYRFDLSDSSNSGHPFAFRLRDGSTSYTDGVIQAGTAGSAGAYTQIHVKQDAPTQLIYYCTVHGNSMGNSVVVQSAFNTILEDNAVISGSLDVTGDITAYSTSDERLKTNVTPILDSLNKIGEIQGYEYDWIENEHHTNTGHDIGVIAQEIEKIAPEAVTTRDNGYKAVKYEKLIPILIQAIKELNDKVKQLEDVHR